LLHIQSTKRNDGGQFHLLIHKIHYTFPWGDHSFFWYQQHSIQVQKSVVIQFPYCVAKVCGRDILYVNEQEGEVSEEDEVSG
jgi:hypothetical protein